MIFWIWGSVAIVAFVVGCFLTVYDAGKSDDTEFIGAGLGSSFFVALLWPLAVAVAPFVGLGVLVYNKGKKQRDRIKYTQGEK